MIHTMLPVQYLTSAEEGLARPQRRLMAAVLQAVVDDCRISWRIPLLGGVMPRDVRRAINYVASSDRAWPFSFENLCQELGLDADGLRRALEVTRAET
jgi:hypothetical protein